MINPRELGLAEVIKNKFIGIQKSKQIYEKLSKSDKKIMDMNKSEVEMVSKVIASRVHKYCMAIKSSGKQLTADMINARVKKELEKL